jgi:hypothetical protein
MKALKHVRISRSGVTARRYHFETSQCRYGVDEDGLRLRFDIASKGGGRTDILVEIGSDGLPAILEEIATATPRALELFTDALRASRVAQAKEQSAELSKLIKGVASLNDYVRERYFEKPIGKDRLEAKLLETSGEVGKLLQELRERAEALLSADPVLPAKKSGRKKAAARSG